MNKKIRNLIIAGVCVVVLVAALILLLVFGQQQNQEDTPSVVSSLVEDEVDTHIIDESVENLDYLTVEGQNGSYTVRLAEEPEEGVDYSFALDGFDGLPLSRSTINTAVSTFAGASYVQVVFEDTAQLDLSLYGLADPSVTVTGSFGGKVYTLYLGGATSGITAQYCMLEGDPALYAVSNSLATTLDVNPNSFLDKTLLESYSSSEDDPLIHLTIHRPDLPEDIVVQPTDTSRYGDSSLTTVGSRYEMVQPVITLMDPDLENELLFNIFGSNAETVVASNPTQAQLEEYGLASPAAVVTMTWDDTGMVLTIGGEVTYNGTACRYVMKDDSVLVYVVDQELLPWVDCTADDLVSSLPLVPNIQNVSTMTISYGGEDYVFQLSQVANGNSTTTRAVYDGRELDSSNFALWYQLVMSCQANGVNRSEVTSDPVMTVTYRYTSGASDTVDYYDMGGRVVVVSVNGAKAVTTSTGFINKVQSELQKLLNGQSVSTDW